MIRLIADSGSTKTAWALVEQSPGQPKHIHTTMTQGLNPLYVTADEIASALKTVLEEFGFRNARRADTEEFGFRNAPAIDRLDFYGSGCSGERIALVEQALRRHLTPMTQVTVCSDLVGAARALTSQQINTLAKQQNNTASPFIACILGTGAIASLYDPQQDHLTPMPALGYILGDEGSGAWFGRHVLSDYLKDQMPRAAREAFEDDFGPITAEQAIRHVYQMPCPNRYLATIAAYLGRHADLRYAQELAYRGIEQFWQRNVMRIPDISDVRMVGSVAYHLRTIIEQVADYHGYIVTRILKDPIEGLV